MEKSKAKNAKNLCNASKETAWIQTLSPNHIAVIRLAMEPRPVLGVRQIVEYVDVEKMAVKLVKPANHAKPIVEYARLSVEKMAVNKTKVKIVAIANKTVENAVQVVAQMDAKLVKHVEIVWQIVHARQLQVGSVEVQEPVNLCKPIPVQM